MIDVGGTKITTTVQTIQRSSYLSGMVDLEHSEGIFIDRDPEIFGKVLRLMRQYPHVAGLLPRDPQMCASLIAEADFLGYDELLSHVKVKTYYNTREPAQPSYACLSAPSAEPAVRSAERRLPSAAQPT